MSDLAWLPEVGTPAALLLVAGWFIHFLKEERKDRAAERIDRAAERDQFLDVITNHMEGLTLAIERLSFKIDERQ